MAETKLLCQHLEYWCTKPATYTCVLCAGRYCGEHLLRVSVTVPGQPAPDVFDLCPPCLAIAIQQLQARGQTLSQWQKRGDR
ncbi:MAG TPA: hypothetical protein VGS80_07705 [Ktedonobacterales bacterium]|nr:hypothetical protein [Ktedonobacterales bacterium]